MRGTNCRKRLRVGRRCAHALTRRERRRLPNGAEVAALAKRGIAALVSVSAEGRRRPHDFRPQWPAKPVRQPKAPWRREAAPELDSMAGRVVSRLRKRTVEPVFGVVKAVLGFARFSLRGLDKIDDEWLLVTLACNCKRLHDLPMAA